MYRRLREGEFGNTLRTWDNFYESLNSGCKSFGVRSTIPNWPYFKTMMSVLEYGVYHAELLSLPEYDTIIWCESQPKDSNLMSGEFCAPPGEYVKLYYSTEPNLTQREAMRKPKEAHGASALAIMRQYMSPASFDNSMRLLETYDNAVVEFTAFNKECGTVPGNNTVVWELRQTW